MAWELCPSYKETDDSEEAPCPRAGHCSAVVGTRMYVWSGRDAYKRVWNTQVSLETGERESSFFVILLFISFNISVLSASVVGINIHLKY